jgi:MHS family proline/betaine transporter-like MFS transporter
MAVLLNELFFPKTDPFVASLISAFGFCSTYLLRPFGALIFGYIGDNFGRKVVVIITTFLMGISCIVIATLPTYAQIGTAAPIILTICRIIQGMSAAAEACGAEMYLTETSKPPAQYPLVASITIASALGTTAALGVAALFTSAALYHDQQSWRMAFFVGAAVAIIGTIGRTSLKEAAEFSNKKVKVKNILEKNNLTLNDTNHQLVDTSVSIWTSVAYFLIQCGRPPCFYFIYIYCGDVLKQQCGFSPNDVINQNFWVSIVDLFGLIGLAYLSLKMNPFTILRWKLYLFFSCLVFFPIVMQYEANPAYIFIFQALASLFVFDHVPATPIFYKFFPIFKRFTYTSLLSAFAKLLTYVITSFGLVYLAATFGFWGLLLIFVPVGIAFFISLKYFEAIDSKF